MDLQGSKVNTIGEEFKRSLPPLIDKLENDPSVKVIVFISAKEGDFIAGADVQFVTVLAAKGKDAVKNEGCMPLHDIFGKMERGKPKIAAINGSCLGGGLEFALACHYRIATDEKGTSLGLPEVMLGLLPGGGGTQRLTKLVGVQNALPMLLTGAAKKVKQAKSLGLVDLVCTKVQLEACAMKVAQDIAEGTMKLPKREGAKGLPGMIEKGIADYAFVRDYVFKQARDGVMKQTGGHFPAPMKILDIVQKSIESNSLAKAKGFELEADGFAEVALTPVSDGLKSVFFGQTAMKKNPFKNPRPVKNVTVLGAGLMGAGIAEITVNKGYKTMLKDMNMQALQRGEQQIEANFKRKVSKKSITEFEKNTILSNLVGLTDDMPFWKKHVAGSDLVIEAVFEDLGLKHKIVKSMEEVVGNSCIIATNTSSLPVAAIAKGAKRPENIVGMHYFSPADKMQLVEVIPHAGTAPEVIATAVAVGLKQGKIPIVCKDVPGFYVNRCLGPYIDESMALAFELENLLDLDKAMKAWGFPVGPLTLADEVGIEVSFHVHANLLPDLKERMSGANVAGMEAIKAAGIKGKRFGSGFLNYPGKKASGIAGLLSSFLPSAKTSVNPTALAAMKPFMKVGPKVSAEEIQTRMSARFINEAVFCLQDGVIRNPVDGDIAAIFGVGTCRAPSLSSLAPSLPSLPRFPRSLASSLAPLPRSLPPALGHCPPSRSYVDRTVLTKWLQRHHLTERAAGGTSPSGWRPARATIWRITRRRRSARIAPPCVTHAPAVLDFRPLCPSWLSRLRPLTERVPSLRRTAGVRTRNHSSFGADQ